LRTGQDSRFAQDEIQDDAQRVGNEDCEQRPEKWAHAAASGIAVDVADEQDGTGEHSSADESDQQH
jgi:hypothetical protein